MRMESFWMPMHECVLLLCLLTRGFGVHAVNSLKWTPDTQTLLNNVERMWLNTQSANHFFRISQSAILISPLSAIFHPRLCPSSHFLCPAISAPNRGPVSLLSASLFAFIVNSAYAVNNAKFSHVCSHQRRGCAIE